MIEPTDAEKLEGIYKAFRDDAEQYTHKIKISSSPKKVVAAGPGTGKTHLFKQILEGKDNALVLTFINALVEELHIQLPGFATIKTLHGYARSILATAKYEILVFNELTDIITEDARILDIKDEDFASKIRLLSDKDELEFYLKRKKYYGNYYSHDDLIYEAVNLLEKEPEKINVFEQVLVDEFQDFNDLEMALIDQLSSKSPILVAGDDDQSLYGFRDSTYRHIRNRHSSKDKEFESFSLPYCFRCPKVVVDAVNDVLDFAKTKGLLDERIDKQYKYIRNEKKDNISKKFPNVVHAERQENAICTFIENELGKIVKAEDTDFNVLIITPFSATSFQNRLLQQMRKKGFTNIGPDQKAAQELLIKGLGLILETGRQYSNLGWRIVAQEILDEQVFKLILEKSLNTAEPFYKLIDTELQKEIRQRIVTIRKLLDSKTIEDEEREKLWEFLSINVVDSINHDIKSSFQSLDHPGLNPGIRNLPIKITNVLRSKGLSADYVFITHLDDRFFLEDKTKVSEKDIFNFMVALSRTKKQVYLLSMPGNKSTLIDVIDKGKATLVHKPSTFKR